tara:strand:+ start:1300 stop:1476 length:177 start_codon:yes stop_codon:yes gene_type:complete
MMSSDIEISLKATRHPKRYLVVFIEYFRFGIFTATYHVKSKTRDKCFNGYREEKAKTI